MRYPIFFYSSVFLRGLLLCVRTNDLAHVCQTSEGAQTVRDLGPIYSDPFATVELRLLSVRCRPIFLFPSCFRTSSIIFYVSEFFRFTLENSDPSSGVEPGSFRFVVRCSSTALVGLGRYPSNSVKISQPWEIVQVSQMLSKNQSK